LVEAIRNELGQLRLPGRCGRGLLPKWNCHDYCQWPLRQLLRQSLKYDVSAGDDKTSAGVRTDVDMNYGEISEGVVTLLPNRVAMLKHSLAGKLFNSMYL
jgi:hypothetical protein